jgi:DNA integrity scanning protein DisA with diadenylate cyclase activity
MDRRSMTESEHCKQGRVFSIENMNDVDTLLVSGVDVNVDVDSRRMAER